MDDFYIKLYISLRIFPIFRWFISYKAAIFVRDMMYDVIVVLYSR